MLQRLFRPRVFNYTRRAFSAVAHASFEEQVNTFFDNAGDNMTIANLTEFMQTSLVQRRMSFDEFRSFGPLLDELVYYAKQADHSETTLDQALVMLKFGHSFEISDD